MWSFQSLTQLIILHHIRYCFMMILFCFSYYCSLISFSLYLVWGLFFWLLSLFYFESCFFHISDYEFDFLFCGCVSFLPVFLVFLKFLIFPDYPVCINSPVLLLSISCSCYISTLCAPCFSLTPYGFFFCLPLSPAFRDYIHST